MEPFLIITIYNNWIYSNTLALKCGLYRLSAEAEKNLLYFTVRMIMLLQFCIA